MKKSLWLFLLVLGSLPFSAIAQKEVPKEIQKTFRLEGKDFTETLEFLVTSDSDELSISARGSNQDGKVKVYIYNPKGKKECALGLNAGKGKAKGNLTEATDNPMPGIWKIKVVNSNSVGKITVTVNQY